MDKMDGKNPTLSMPLADGSKLVRRPSIPSALPGCFRDNCCACNLILLPVGVLRYRCSLQDVFCASAAAAQEQQRHFLRRGATRFPYSFCGQQLIASRLAQVFNAVVVFPEAYVENEAGVRVPVPPEFLKASSGAAEAFNALPRTCEKVAAVKRSAEEDNDNERWRWLSVVVIAVSHTVLQVQGQLAQAAAARRRGRLEQRCGRGRGEQQRQRRAHFPRR
jgi:hypothetical protein